MMKELNYKPISRSDFDDAAETRFWSKVRTGAPHECWDWCASLNEHGYGQFKKPNGPMMLAHRAAYALSRRETPTNRNLLHCCDNPKCCNPSHLRPGTHMENTADMINRGRYVRGISMAGEKHHKAKLTDDKVRAILADKRLPREICLDYGVCVSTIQYIKSGIRWSHIERPKC